MPTSRPSPVLSARPRVVVVGAGFGGLSVVKSLAGVGFDVTLIDRRNHHLFQPLLYQVATAGLEPSDVASAARGITRRLAGVGFMTGEVVGADLDARTLTTREGQVVDYDYLVLAAGARTATFGVAGVAEHTYGLKSLEDALAFRGHLLSEVERCAGDPGAIDAGALNVVIVGGGPTGVEMAGAVSELFAMVLQGDYPEVDLRRARVTLVEMADNLLTAFHPSLQRSAERELAHRGVEVRLGTAVAAVHDDHVQLDGGESIPTSTVLWAAGVEAEPLGAALGLETDRAGRITVAGDLSVPGRPEVFVIGDLAAARGRDGDLLPQLAPVAMQQGDFVAAAVRKRQRGRRAGTFRYRDKGTMATIGRRAAVAQLPFGIRFRGTPAWLAWLGLHLYFLIGFRNRVSVMINWGWNYLTWDRAARVITKPYDRL